MVFVKKAVSRRLVLTPVLKCKFITLLQVAANAKSSFRESLEMAGNVKLTSVALRERPGYLEKGLSIRPKKPG